MTEVACLFHGVQGGRLFRMPHILADSPMIVEICWSSLSKGPYLVTGAQQLPSSDQLDQLSGYDDHHWTGLSAFLSAREEPYPTQVSCQTLTA